MTTTNVKRKDVAQIVAATFPDYKGRKFRIEPRTTWTLSNLNWDGGTRSQYRTCTLDGSRSLGRADRYNAMAPWANDAEGKVMPVPQGAIIVEHVMHCGRDEGLYIYVNPQDMPKLLEAARG